MAGMEVMREYVSRQYGGDWRNKVEKMPAKQVAAIFNKMMSELDGVKSAGTSLRLRETEVAGGEQLCLFEGRRSKRIKEEYLNDGTDEAAYKNCN